MELLIWRHAEAEHHHNDLERHLTKKGQQQAAKMSKWIKKYYPSDYTLWVSEAYRTQETASFLKHPMTIKATLNPVAPTSIILDEILHHILSQNLLLVGHQPWVGEVSSYLISHTNQIHSQPKFSYWSFKKGSICWLEIKINNEHQFYTKVKAILPPSLLD